MDTIRIHGFIERSEVNGPGVRSVIHFQGCTLQCPGCFNPETHSVNGGEATTIDAIMENIPPDVEGVTISGGEPFLQQRGLYTLVKRLNREGYTIVVFSGFYRREIERMTFGRSILKCIDALIDGRFDESKTSEAGTHGSDNQTVHLLTNRYSLQDFENREVEITIDPNGQMVMTGFPSKEMRKILKGKAI